MGRPKKIRLPLPPIWEDSDDLYSIVESILTEGEPLRPRARKRINQCASFDASIFPLTTPMIVRCVPPYTFQRWIARGILTRWEMKGANCLGQLTLACGLLWFHRYHRLPNLR